MTTVNPLPIPVIQNNPFINSFCLYKVATLCHTWFQDLCTFYAA